jgi:hypothetical protein
MNLGPSFIIFRVLKNLQSYEFFLNGSTKFTWILNPNSDSSLEFKTWHNLSNFHVWTDSDMIQTFFEFGMEFY